MILNRKYKALLAGTFTLLIVMGLSRFAYTPIFPMMQRELGFTDQFAGFLASINYAGYLLGSVFAGYWNWKNSRASSLKIYLIINSLSIVLMGISENYTLWYFLRFIAGLTAGIIFVLISSIIMDYLTEKKMTHLTGFFYAGVGTGIFFGGISVPYLADFFGWKGTWYGVGALAFLLTYFVSRWVPDEKNTVNSAPAKVETMENKEHKQISLPWLIIAYTAEGIGYIISGTFLVAIVSNIPGFNSHSASLSWAFVGLAAAPSCILWVRLADHFGKIPMLKLAYIIQIFGISLPLVFQNNIGAFLGALLFGGTFMGITTLSIATAKILFPENSSRIIGQLTFFYAGGQIIGPIVAGYLTKSTGSYNSSIIFASIILVIGVISLTLGERRKA